MKKTIYCVLCAAMLLSFTGCSSNSQNSTSDQKKQAESFEDDRAFRRNKGNRFPMDENGGGGGLGGKQADTTWIKNKITDISYASVSETQKLDIYYPNEEQEPPYPVIIAIHGGGFMMGSKTGGDIQPMLEGVNHGYAVVSVNYRLSSEAVFPGAISDIKAAIRFIRANAETYHLDPDKIAVWGDSSGGNLAAMAGTTGDDDSLNGDNTENMEYSSSVNAVVDWFGPLDFLQMDAQFEAAGITPKMGKTSSDSSPESKYIGGNITENVEQTERANPANYITENDPCFLIQHGSADSNVPVQQSENFAEALAEILGSDKVQFDILEGAGHGTSEFESEENLNKVFAFLDSSLGV